MTDYFHSLSDLFLKCLRSVQFSLRTISYISTLCVHKKIYVEFDLKGGFVALLGGACTDV